MTTRLYLVPGFGRMYTSLYYPPLSFHFSPHLFSLLPSHLPLYRSSLFNIRLISFTGTRAFSTLVNSEGIVQVRLSSQSAVDNCNIDFLQLSVTTSSSTSSSTAATSSASLTSSTTSPTPRPTTRPTPSPTPRPTPTSPPSSGGKLCGPGTWYQPGPYTTWQWQLSGDVDTSFDVQLYGTSLPHFLCALFLSFSFWRYGYVFLTFSGIYHHI